MNSESALPRFVDLELKADGWIKKYVLHYELPDGTAYCYDSASRKGPEAYRAELEANGRGETPRADAVCVVPRTRENKLVLIKEFRYPLNSWCVAFPAGLIDPGEEVYAGEVVGEHVHDNDLVVNVTKAKQLTNTRASGSDDKARIVPRTVLSLEEALEYIKEDELVEVTPKSMRMRKIILDHNERKRANKQ